MNNRFQIVCFCCFIILFQVFSASAFAATQDWQYIDRQVQNRIFEVNVGINIKIQDGPWVQLTGLSPKQHYYVFTTTPNDQGYQVVGHGSCFPLATANKQKTFFVTSEHVLAEAAETIEECQMFFAAVQFYASETTIGTDVEPRKRELLNTINLSLKKDMCAEERSEYIQTVDAIWNCYDTSLSAQADPKRLLYNKYKKLASLQVKITYLLHAPGPATQPAIETKVYKIAPNHKFDLAILVAKLLLDQVIKTLDLDPIPPKYGQEIQAVGYPIATQKIDIEPIQYYEPTFTNGKIIKVMPNLFEFDALIGKGNSGGPVITDKGKVLGVVTFKKATNNKLSNYGVAVGSQCIKLLAPELFNTR